MEITEELKTEILAGLRAGEKTVTFTKVNGDKRVMTCTLQEGVIPPATKTDPLSQKKVRAVNPEVQVVYDVEKDGWRSFRWDSLVAWKDQ